MKTVKVLALVLCISTFFACSKDIDSDIDIVPSVVSDSNFIDKIYLIEYRSTGNDTFFVKVLYDSLKRVVAIFDSTSNIPGRKYSNIFTYFYNGTDNQPFKSMDFSTPSTSDEDTVVTFHFYDSQSRKTKDSSMRIYHNPAQEEMNTTVIIYSYAANKMFGETVKVPQIPAGAAIYTKDTATLDAKGNIISDKNYLFNGTDYVLNVTSDFTYDDHPSPFSKRSNFLAHRQFSTAYIYTLENMGYNNIITQDQTSTFPQYQIKVANTYSYNAAGYPLIQNSTESTSLPWKTIFVYKAL